MHLSAYAAAGLAAVISFNGLWLRCCSLACLLLMGVALEFFQCLVPGRSFEVYDMCANTSGIALALIVCRYS